MHESLGLVSDFISNNKLFNGDEKNILIGLSGGADSVCLLFMFMELKKEGRLADTEIIAAHLNHGIRGDEALRDERFTKDLCNRLNIRLFTKQLDVPQIARDEKESEEQAGRRLRYEFFRDILKKEGGGLIATAHHKNDQAETVLMNIARGTGLTGLAGIHAKQNDIIRPLLCLTRVEIESYLKSISKDYVQDSTNESDIYTRNYLRHNVIPLIEANVNSGFIEHIYRLSKTALIADEFLREEGESLLGKCEIRDDEICVSAELIALQKKIIRKYFYRSIFKELTGSVTDFSAERLDELDRLAMDGAQGKRKGKVIELPHGVRARVSGENIIFIGASKDKEAYDEEGERKYIYKNLLDSNIRERLEHGEQIVLESGSITIGLKLTENFVKNDDCDYTKYFDYDKINDTACFRYAEPDDWIRVTADGKKHSLKKELKNKKVSAKDRKRILTLAEGKECLWAAGVRRSMSALVREGHKILEVQIISCAK